MTSNEEKALYQCIEPECFDSFNFHMLMLKAMREAAWEKQQNFHQRAFPQNDIAKSSNLVNQRYSIFYLF